MKGFVSQCFKQMGEEKNNSFLVHLPLFYTVALAQRIWTVSAVRSNVCVPDVMEAVGFCHVRRGAGCALNRDGAIGTVGEPAVQQYAGLPRASRRHATPYPGGPASIGMGAGRAVKRETGVCWLGDRPSRRPGFVPVRSGSQPSRTPCASIRSRGSRRSPAPGLRFRKNKCYTPLGPLLTSVGSWTAMEWQRIGPHNARKSVP